MFVFHSCLQGQFTWRLFYDSSSEYAVLTVKTSPVAQPPESIFLCWGSIEEIKCVKEGTEFVHFAVTQKSSEIEVLFLIVPYPHWYWPFAADSGCKHQGISA